LHVTHFKFCAISPSFIGKTDRQRCAGTSTISTIPSSAECAAEHVSGHYVMPFTEAENMRGMLQMLIRIST
jgi:hypothetical protein